MITLSVIKADTGGYVGHSATHPEMIDTAKKQIEEAKGDVLVDGQVAWCGDDLFLIMTHRHGIE
ncbi:MAG TPA: fructose 1,6-bisphosphatase, partial [Actinomycetota bacterium]|nr:fructose 1,6-bisphosphatase [Actinomycetota bacterium]